MATCSRRFVLFTAFAISAASPIGMLATLGGCSPRAETVATRAVQQERPAEIRSKRGARVATARPPSLVPLRDRQVLVYEVAITPPPGGVPLSIDRIEVLEGSRPFASVEAPAIAASMIVRGANLEPIRPTPTTVAADQAAVIFMMHELPKDATIAASLRVSVALRYTDGETEIASLDIPILPVAPVVLGPPLRGGPWLALNALSNTSIHRRSLFPFPSFQAPERYAIDYLLADDSGRYARAPGTKNEDHNAYGKELLAVGDGTVRLVTDGFPDNPPGKGPDKVTRENISGNYVSLALDVGGFAFYAHIQPGTIRVKVDDRVKKGDVLGLLGNSGNTSAPHLHIHVSDRPDPIESEGVPFVFESFSYVGKIADGTPDQVVWSVRANEPQKRVLPAEDEANAF